MSALGDAKTLAKYNNDLERANVKLQYDYNRSLAQEDRSWQERMANSAHQREIADLKAAGLNPVLSVTGGNGAATPSGSSASVSKPNIDMSLPRAVMDMAIAQLNSATALQTTAMNNANAWNMHTTPSANSPLGAVEYLVDSLASYANDSGGVLAGFLNNSNKSGARGLSGKIRGKTATAYDSIEMTMRSNQMKIQTLKLSGNSFKDKRELRRLERQQNRLKHYYPNVWKKIN